MQKDNNFEFITNNNLHIMKHYGIHFPLHYPLITNSFYIPLVFDYVGKKVVETAFNAFNCTVFAYGQTGSGKTFTLMGVVPRTCEHLFGEIRKTMRILKILLPDSKWKSGLILFQF